MLEEDASMDIPGGLFAGRCGVYVCVAGGGDRWLWNGNPEFSCRFGVAYGHPSANHVGHRSTLI